ncbi:MAG: hypothetical protein WDO70_08605 [Alphaproteobacteria bacterium]
MYLFTLIFIFVTIVGLFTQVLAMQNTRFIGRQTGGAQQMLAWHSAVVQAARWSIVNPPNPPAPAFPGWGVTTQNPCTIYATAQVAWPGAPAQCIDNSGVPPALAFVDNLAIDANPLNNVRSLLPAGFATRFRSVIFTANNTRLVVTFVQPDATGDANAILPPVGLTASQLYRQFGRLEVDRGAFGYAVGTRLQPAAAATTTDAAGAPVNINGLGVYDIPGGVVPPGAIALFTPI